MKRSSVIAVLCILLLVTGLVFYFYKSYYAMPPGYEECFDEIAPPRPASLALTPPPAVEIPAMVKAQAMLLPDIPSIKSMPGLREEAARQKAAGSDVLIKAVTAFRSHAFTDLFTADDSMRQEVREIMFLLAGTDQLAEDSRGRFINARELATMERFGGEHYLQLGEFPNPTPPASVHLADAFDKMLDVYFYMLAMSGPGRELYVPSGEGILSGFKVELTRKSLDQFIAESGRLTDEASKRAFWQNSLRMLRTTLSPLNPLVPELDAAIRASLGDQGISDVLTMLEGGDEDEEINVLTVNPGIFAPEKIALLADKAKTFKSPEAQTVYWTNVVRLARQGLAAGWNDVVGTKNLLALDGAIRETAPHLNLKVIQEHLQEPVTTDDKYFTDKKGRRLLVEVMITKEKPGRTVCLKRPN